MDEKIVKLQELIDQHDNIVFFGGAGVSTESGIPDFTGNDSESFFFSESSGRILQILQG